MNEKYYAAYLNNEEQLKLSSSGGMAYAISEQIILSGGVVFGIRYSNGIVKKSVFVKTH